MRELAEAQKARLRAAEARLQPASRRRCRRLSEPSCPTQLARHARRPCRARHSGTRIGRATRHRTERERLERDSSAALDADAERRLDLDGLRVKPPTADAAMQNATACRRRRPRRSAARPLHARRRAWRGYRSLSAPIAMPQRLETEVRTCRSCSLRRHRGRCSGRSIDSDSSCPRQKATRPRLGAALGDDLDASARTPPAPAHWRDSGGHRRVRSSAAAWRRAAQPPMSGGPPRSMRRLRQIGIVAARQKALRWRASCSAPASVSSRARAISGAGTASPAPPKRHRLPPRRLAEKQSPERLILSATPRPARESLRSVRATRSRRPGRERT